MDREGPHGRITGVWRLLGGTRGMLQWKPKLIALVAVLVLIAALLGQFTWEAFADQFTW